MSIRDMGRAKLAREAVSASGVLPDLDRIEAKLAHVDVFNRYDDARVLTRAEARWLVGVAKAAQAQSDHDARRGTGGRAWAEWASRDRELRAALAAALAATTTQEPAA